ncbi:helix-turn-helix domain-containing protein [Fodinicola acaciae]|uniref:helix-turn-helix domain-containing protein n=1 Tax=Fodinicola acaciae TaxID=2681555 RepID=UPI001C9E798E|nr:AraC family transcriptional regulator [Fodinicola acaciae]
MYEERLARLPGALLWTRTDPLVPAAAPTRVLPDGCIDLIWVDGELMVAGPDTVAQLSPASPGRHYAGIRFRPGLGPEVFGVPAYELVNRRVPLAELWPAGRVRRLTGEVSAAHDRGHALERIAGDALAGREPDPLTRALAVDLRKGVSVADAAGAAGLSERQLLRRCRQAFGYGPKTLMRIIRFGRALDAARIGTPYATVAIENGYADQAHFARDVKALAGVSLRGLLTQEAG